jgi:hypothetical protein
LNSLVTDVVREEYKKGNSKKFIVDDLKLLQINRIKALRQWSSLPVYDKNKYPDGLKMILNNACRPEGK